jgi:Flp pilus assembly protein TadG
MKIAGDLHRQVVALGRYLPRFAAASRTSVKARSIGGRLRASFRCGDEGQSLVELAFALPVLLMVLTGILSLGYFFFNDQALTYATQQAATTLQELPGMSGASDPCNAAATAFIGASQGNLILTGTSGVQLTVQVGTYSYGPHTPSPIANFTCSAGAAYVLQGASTTVTATYPCSVGVYGFNFASLCPMQAVITEPMQ